MTDKDELINAFEVLAEHCSSKNMICTTCEIRFTCCKHIKTSMFDVGLIGQLELSGAKND